MGTNYYLDLTPCITDYRQVVNRKTGSIIATCATPELAKQIAEHLSEANCLHIGKSSPDWVFALHWIQNRAESLQQWRQLFEQRHVLIRDEYGTEITPEQMLAIITERSGEPRQQVSDLPPYAILGPNNLLRHKLPNYCKSHGEGTWDMVPGDFS